MNMTMPWNPVYEAILRDLGSADKSSALADDFGTTQINMFQTRKVDAISVIFSGGEGPSLVHCTDVIGQTTFSVSFHNLPQGA